MQLAIALLSVCKTCFLVILPFTQHSVTFNLTMEFDQWSSFFNAITSLLENAEGQYGFANQQYTEYVLERMQLSITSCRSLKAHMETTSSVEFHDYIQSLQALLECLVFIRHKWFEYQDILDT